MSRVTALLSIALVAVLYSPASKAQAFASPVPSGTASTDTLNTTAKDEPGTNAEVSDSPDSANTTRIVRLSQASGKVEMDRNLGLGFEAAFNNLPITEGARLKTGEGTAEVEFEDGSTLRLIPDTEVDFTQLGRSTVGATVSSMNVLKGTVYVSLNKTKGNTFNLTTGDGVIKPRPGSHLRLEVKDPESRLSVVSGTADFTNTAGSHEVGKMKSLIFNTATHASADLIAGIEGAPFDTWDEQQTEYHKQYSHGNALAGSGSTYGLADLNYYGAFSDVDGCGRIWRPYFTSAGWDPYASGIWTLYPGSGYSWVSPYPWGWAPFHYGSWLQCGGGWGWQPGGGWYGLTTRHRGWDHDRHRFPPGPIRVHPFPPRPRPIPGKVGSMIAVNQRPLTFSHVDRATRSFDFRNDSAGLGIPRGEFGKLNKLSETAGKAGSSHVPLFFAPSSASLSPVANRGLAARDDRASGARIGDHAGYFNRPTSQNREAHNVYAEHGGGNIAGGVQHGTGAYASAARSGAGTPNTAAGYASSNHPQGDRGSNGGYSASPRSYGGAGAYHGGGGGYGGGGGSYSGGSHPGGGSYSGGGGGYSGSSHAGGGGYSGGGGGGSHASAPSPSASGGHH